MFTLLDESCGIFLLLGFGEFFPEGQHLLAHHLFPVEDAILHQSDGWEDVEEGESGYEDCCDGDDLDGGLFFSEAGVEGRVEVVLLVVVGLSLLHSLRHGLCLSNLKYYGQLFTPHN